MRECRVTFGLFAESEMSDGHAHTHAALVFAYVLGMGVSPEGHMCFMRVQHRRIACAALPRSRSLGDITTVGFLMHPISSTCVSFLGPLMSTAQPDDSPLSLSQLLQPNVRMLHEYIYA